MIKLRQYLHTIPELSFQEYKTSKFIKEKLESFGIETYTICNTGIIGVLQSKVNKDCINIGIRADLDALPIEEINNVEHKSSHSGCMHACGHDGHMAIVLGVAEYFSKTMNFLGTIYFIFSPAEEEGGGCKKMLEDPLFNAFKIDEIYGLHNWPELEIGKIGVSDSIVMAGDDNFSIEIVGKSGHGAMPQFAINPIDYITDVLDYLKELQNLYDVILTPTNVSGGDCYNVIPDSVIINGTFRYLSKEERENVLYKLNNVNIDGININVTIIDGYPPTINNKECAQYCKKIVNNMNDVTLYDITTSSMATEDFSYLLEEIPGCYVWLGSKDDKHQAGLHNANYDFNDKILDIGFEYFKNIIINKSKFNPNPVFLGFIQVPTDYTLDVEINGILSQIDYIKWRLLKLPSVNDPNINSDMFHKLKDKIRETSSNFIPQPNDENIYGTINVISLACTSMSFVLTPKVVHDEIRAGYPTIANDMASSVLNAINAFKRTTEDIKLGLLTPYIKEIHNTNVEFLKDYNIVVQHNLNLENDSLTSAVTTDYIEMIIETMMNEKNVNVFIIGCSAFNVTQYGFIDKLENKFGCSFITSNQALLWYTLHKALDDNRKNDIKSIKGYGKLFGLDPL